MGNEEWSTVYTDVAEAIRDKQEMAKTQSQETLRSVRNGLQIRSNETTDNKTTKSQQTKPHCTLNYLSLF